MAEIINVAAEFVVQIYSTHETIIEESGGLVGLRDGAMLHAAVARPFAPFAGEDLYSDDFEKAITLKTIPEIAAWFRQLVGIDESIR